MAAASSPARSTFRSLLLLALLFLIAPQLASSRPINGFLCFELQEVDQKSSIALPAAVGGSGGELDTPAAPKPQQLAGKYKPLLLSFLPRGRVPPSGPSPGINNHNP